MFVVSSVDTDTNPETYEVEDYAGERVKGSFYRQELQRVKKPSTYRVEEVLQTRKVGGRKPYYVKWLGYPESFNSWVNEEDMV